MFKLSIIVWIVVLVGDGALSAQCTDYAHIAVQAVYSARNGLNKVLSLGDPSEQNDHTAKVNAARLRAVMDALGESGVAHGRAPCTGRSYMLWTPVESSTRYTWPFTGHVRHDNDQYPKRKQAYQYASEKLISMRSGWKDASDLLSFLKDKGNKSDLAEVLGFLFFANAIKDDISYEEFAGFLPRVFEDRDDREFVPMPIVRVHKYGNYHFTSSVDHLICLTNSILQAAFESELAFCAGRDALVPPLFLWEAVLGHRCTNMDDLWQRLIRGDAWLYAPNERLFKHVIKNTEGGYRLTLSDSEMSFESNLADDFVRRLQGNTIDNPIFLYALLAGLSNIECVAPFNMCLRLEEEPRGVRRKLVLLNIWMEEMRMVGIHLFASDYEVLTNESDLMSNAAVFAKWPIPAAVLTQRAGSGWEGVVSHSQVMYQLSVSRNAVLHLFRMPHITMQDAEGHSTLAAHILLERLSQEEGLRNLKWEYALEDVLEACDDLVESLGEEGALRTLFANWELLNPSECEGSCRLVYALDFFQSLCGRPLTLEDLKGVQEEVGWKAQRQLMRTRLMEVVHAVENEEYLSICKVNNDTLCDFVADYPGDQDRDTIATALVESLKELSDGGQYYVDWSPLTSGYPFLRPPSQHGPVAKAAVLSAHKALEAVCELETYDRELWSLREKYPELGVPDVHNLQMEGLKEMWYALHNPNLQQGCLPKIDKILSVSDESYSAHLMEGRSLNGKRQYWPYTRFVRWNRTEFPKRKRAYEYAVKKLESLHPDLRELGVIPFLKLEKKKSDLAEVLGFFAFANAVREDVSYAEFIRCLTFEDHDKNRRTFEHMPMINIEDDCDSFFKASVDHLLLLTYDKMQYAFQEGRASLVEAQALEKRGIEDPHPPMIPRVFSWHCMLREALTHRKKGAGLWRNSLQEGGVFNVRMPEDDKLLYLKSDLGFQGLSKEDALEALQKLVSESVPPRAGVLWLFQVVAGLCSLDQVPPFNLCLYQTQDPLEVRCKIIRLMFWEDSLCAISQNLLNQIRRHARMERFGGSKRSQDIDWDAQWFAKKGVISAILAQRLGAGWEGIAAPSRAMHRVGLGTKDFVLLVKPVKSLENQDCSLAGEIVRLRLSGTMSERELRYLQWEWALEDLLEACNDALDERDDDFLVRIVQQDIAGKTSSTSAAYACEMWRLLCGCELSGLDTVFLAQSYHLQHNVLRKYLTDIIETKEKISYKKICEINCKNIMNFVDQCTNDDKEKQCIADALDMSLRILKGEEIDFQMQIDWPIKDKDLSGYTFPKSKC